MYTLTLYTHPWCSDCQLSKQELTEAGVPYTEVNLSEQPEKEAALRKATGARVVPGFVFQKRSLLGKMQKPVVFTGYEQNKAEIMTMVKQVKTS